MIVLIAICQKIILSFALSRLLYLSYIHSPPSLPLSLYIYIDYKIEFIVFVFNHLSIHVPTDD